MIEWDILNPREQFGGHGRDKVRACGKQGQGL